MEEKKEYTAIVCLNCGTSIYCGDELWRHYDDGDEYFCSAQCVAEYLAEDECADEGDYREIAHALDVAGKSNNIKKVSKEEAIELNIIEETEETNEN